MDNTINVSWQGPIGMTPGLGIKVADDTSHGFRQKWVGRVALSRHSGCFLAWYDNVHPSESTRHLDVLNFENVWIFVDSGACLGCYFGY